MGEAIGDVLPLAVGVALSPIPIIAVVLMLDDLSAPKALGAGALLSGLNPKNLLLAVGAAAAVAATGISTAAQGVAYAVFAVIATVSVAAPVVIYLVLGDRAAAILDALKTWMVRHNSAIMATLCLVIGVKLLGDGIAGL